MTNAYDGTPTTIVAIIGGVSYHRKFLSQMAVNTRTNNNLLKKAVNVLFTTEHLEIVQALLIKRLSSVGTSRPHSCHFWREEVSTDD